MADNQTCLSDAPVPMPENKSASPMAAIKQPYLMRPPADKKTVENGKRQSNPAHSKKA